MAGDRGDLAQQAVDMGLGRGRGATVATIHAVGAQQRPPHVAHPHTPIAMSARRTGAAALPAPRADMGREIATPTVTVQARYQQ